MARLVLCLLPIAGLAFPLGAEAQDKNLEQALALQKVMQRIIAEAEPAVACILVSRGELYGRLGGQPVTPDLTGKLGDVDARNKSDQERRKLDLADPDHVPEGFGSGVVI